MTKDLQMTSPAAAYQQTGRYVKCVVWDLDDTLWRGILAENDELTLREDLIDVIKTLDGRGILHSIASRNDDEFARAQLKRFGILEYFLFPQISWGPKSQAIRTIAEKLNLGLDAFAFVDDQPFELAEVAHHVPEILCIPVEDAGRLPSFPPFQPRFVTEDSRLRRTMYINDQERASAEEEFHGTDEQFLASLDMKLTIQPARESDLQRAEELTIRTHQLNSTGRFYSYEDLNELRKDDRFKVLVMDLEDRFGPYGRIGLAVVECQETAWIVKLVLMSCRVVSRGVGGVMLTHLKQAATQAGVRLLAEFLPTPRNRMMYVALKFNGFQEIDQDGEIKLLENAASECPPLPSFMDIHILNK